MSKLLLGLGLCLLALNAQAYVACSGVPVTVNTTTTASFHNMSEVGVTGAVLFVPVSPARCTDSTGTAMASTVFLVVDGYANADELKKLWASMLLSAEARGKTIQFHASNLGVNSRGFQLLKPYYLGVNP